MNDVPFQDNDILPATMATSLDKLTKDLKGASKKLDQNQARLLVDRYYQVQRDRIRAEQQAKVAEEGDEPNELLLFFAAQATMLENQLKVVLDLYSLSHPVGIWARGQMGVGPVIAAGLLAHIDIHKAPTAGHIWSFAGLEPTSKWNKGEKRPWNADLKVLCAFKLGESFVKVSGRENAFYGQLYKQQKQKYREKNEAGGFADLAASTLLDKKFGEDTVAIGKYREGKLPDARIHAMARRWAVKIFLAHLQEVWYEHEFGVKPPLPYPIAIQGHAHKIEVPPAIPVTF